MWENPERVIYVGRAPHDRFVADAVLLQEAATLLKSKEEDIPAKIEQLLTALKEAEREVAQLSHKLATSSLDDILAAKEEIHGVSSGFRHCRFGRRLKRYGRYGPG